jgi:hypothetical protein
MYESATGDDYPDRVVFVGVADLSEDGERIVESSVVVRLFCANGGNNRRVRTRKHDLVSGQPFSGAVKNRKLNLPALAITHGQRTEAINGVVKGAPHAVDNISDQERDIARNVAGHSSE